MKLEPRAKPVRFQITFGDLETNSIEVLKRLSIKKVYALFKEGTLEKFLEQEGDTQRLRDVREFKPTGESVGNYIRLIGLINSDLSKCLNSVKSLNGWKTKEIDGILKSLHVDTLNQIYTLIRKDREEDGEEEKGIWTEFWKGLITKEKNWNGIEWKPILESMSLNDLLNVYQEISVLQKSDRIKWGEIFAQKIPQNNDWETFNKIYQLLTPEHKKSFQEVSGINPDPWAGFSSIINKKRIREIYNAYNISIKYFGPVKAIDDLYWKLNTYFEKNFKDNPVAKELISFIKMLSDLFKGSTAKVNLSYNTPVLRGFCYDLNNKLNELFEKDGNRYQRRQTIRDYLEKIIKSLLDS